MKAKEFLIRTGKLLSAVLFLSVAGCGLAQAALHVSVKIPVTVRVSGNAPEESGIPRIRTRRWQVPVS